jgi:hypothetical protein
MRSRLQDVVQTVVAALITPSRLLAVVAASFACSSPFGPGDLRELVAARQLWESRGFADYVFDTRHGCFCRPDQVGPVRVTVREGAIVDVTFLETGEALSPDNWYTIEQLFELIPTFDDQDGVEDVAAEYDATLGYPTTVSVRFEEGVLDAGDLYTITAVGPAP